MRAVIWFTSVICLLALCANVGMAQTPSLTANFSGSWVDARDENNRIIIADDVLIWERKIEGNEIIVAKACTVSQDERSIQFKGTEVDSVNYHTGEKLKRDIDVTIKQNGDTLTVTVAPSKTQLSDSGLVVMSPERSSTYNREGKR